MIFDSIVTKVSLTVLVVYVTTKLTLWFIGYVYKLRIINKIPGLFPMLPLIGNAHQLNNGPDFFRYIIKRMEEKPENMVRLWIGTIPLIFIRNPEYLEFLVNSSKHITKSDQYKLLFPWLGTGLLTSTGDKWAKRRRILTPSFHFEILNDFLLVMNEQSDIFIQNIANQIKTNKDGFDICPLISNCTLDIICETAMGQCVHAQKEKDSEYVTAVVKITYIIFKRMINPFLQSDFIFNNLPIGKEHQKHLKTVKDFTRNVIIKRSAEVDEEGFLPGRRMAFLDTLLKYKKEDPTLTFDDIQEEVDTFMFEGHDTTAAAVSWACFLIGSHPEIQQKIHEEVDNIFGNSERHVNNDDLSKLKYLECCIKETLRIFPSVAFFGRTTDEDVQCKEFLIPKGTVVNVVVQQVHRDPRYFPNPERFDPDRFLPENSLDRHAYAYIPFSAGKRNCIGQKFALMEEKVMLSSIFRKYKITTLQTLSETKEDFELILRPGNGIKMKFEQRQH